MRLPRFQFRLRTLMIVVTLAAVACWVIMDRQRLIRERDDAVQAHVELKLYARKLEGVLDELHSDPINTSARQKAHPRPGFTL